MKLNRVILIVIDGFGIGALPDSSDYGDDNCNTFRTLLKNGAEFKHLRRLGLYKASGYEYENEYIKGIFGKMTEQSKGKDTLTGHWEIAGAITNKAFPTFYDGFPKGIINQLEEEFGCGLIGNIKASGTAIINDLGDEHCKTGKVIVYTSGDSVLQLAAHEKIISLDKLYKYCKKAREIMKNEYNVGRIVARPFMGEDGRYTRTNNRKDYVVTPPKNLLDVLINHNVPVYSIGKIDNIFDGRGITSSVHTHGNSDGLSRIEEFLDKYDKGLIFVNLIDTDMLYGHRNDVEGYVNAMKEIDEWVGNYLGNLDNGDLLIITGDHGCDPGYPGTDHTREYTPLLAFTTGTDKAIDIGVRKSFADIAATILEGFSIANQLKGDSFWKEIVNQTKKGDVVFE